MATKIVAKSVIFTLIHTDILFKNAYLHFLFCGTSPTHKTVNLHKAEGKKTCYSLISVHATLHLRVIIRNHTPLPSRHSGIPYETTFRSLLPTQNDCPKSLNHKVIITGYFDRITWL